MAELGVGKGMRQGWEKGLELGLGLERALGLG